MRPAQRAARRQIARPILDAIRVAGGLASLDPPMDFIPSAKCQSCAKWKVLNDTEAKRITRIVTCTSVTCSAWETRLTPNLDMSDVEKAILEDKANARRDEQLVALFGPAAAARINTAGAVAMYTSEKRRLQRHFRTRNRTLPRDAADKVRELSLNSTSTMLKTAARLQLKIVGAWAEAGLWGSKVSLANSRAVATWAVNLGHYQAWMENAARHLTSKVPQIHRTQPWRSRPRPKDADPREWGKR